MTEQFANNASTTLNGAINNSITSVNVTNGAPFSQTGTFRVIVDSEIMIVNTNSGNVFSVLRGQEGTAAVAHLSGAVITQIVTAGSIAQLKTDVSVVGLMHSGTSNPNTFPIFIQGINTGGTTATTASSVTSGNLLVVFVQCETSSPNPSPPTDNLGTSYALLSSIEPGSGQVFGAVYAGIAASSGICTITGHQAGSFARTSVGEYKYATTTVDNSNNGSNVNSLNVTISEANSLVVGIVGDFSSSSTFTAGTGMTANFFGNGSDSTFYESDTTPPPNGTFTATYTSTHGTAGNVFFVIVFRPQSNLPASVGNDGDYFIDTTNRILYGPRASGIYPRIGSLSP